MPRQRLPREVLVLGLVVILVGLLIAAALAWFAAEHHYDNCIDAAKATHPIGQRSTAADARQRRAAVDGCSHLP